MNEKVSNRLEAKRSNENSILVKHRGSNSCDKCYLSQKVTENRRNFSKPGKKIVEKLKPNEKIGKLIVVDKRNSGKNVSELERVQVVDKFSYRTVKGVCPNSLTKPNQDSCIVNPDLAADTFLFCVADGHGPFGEFVSSYIQSRYPYLLKSNIFFRENLQKCLKSSIETLSKEIKHQSFDTSISGSTLTSILIRGSLLYCANIGDSRVILGRQNSNSGSWLPIPISRDHKPENPEESARIRNKGGRIDTLHDYFGTPIGPARVWLKNQNYPGLAMSRSLGDKIAASVGVISEPDIFQVNIKDDDKFAVIASDGVFEVLDNLDVVKIVASCWADQNVDKAADQIAKFARSAWLKCGDKVDDVSCIVVFFHKS